MPDADALSAGLAACSAEACAGVGSSAAGGARPSSAAGAGGRSSGGAASESSVGGAELGAGTAGAGDAAGSSGAAAGGANGDAGGNAANGGAANGGVGGSVDSGGSSGESSEPPCGGCARARIPIQLANTSQALLAIFNTTVDLQGVAIVVRLRAPGATGGTLQIFAQDTTYAGDYTFNQSLSNYATTEMTDVTYVVPMARPGYDTAHIRLVAVQVAAGNAGSCSPGACTWTQPTVLEIDSISFSGGSSTVPDPFTFDTSASPLTLTLYQPIAGSTLSWIP